MDLILFGMQGSGKGTLGRTLAENFNMQIFDTGGALRELMKEDSKLSRKIKEIVNRGDLVPNDIIMEIVQDFIEKSDKTKSVIFDGIPRSVIQSETLIQTLEKNNRKYKALLLDISEKTALTRLTTRKMCKSCGAIYPADYTKNICTKKIDGKICNGELYTRADDIPDAIQKRLENYKESTIPAMEKFKNQLIIIDGEPNINEVKKSAFKILNELLK